MDRDDFRTIFDNCPEALLVARDGLVTMVNAEGRRLIGGSLAAALVGRRLEEIIPMDIGSRSGLYSSLGRLSAGDVRSYEWDLILPGPAYIPVQIRAAGLPGGAVLISVRDLSEAKGRARSLAEAEEQRQAIIEACPLPVFGIDRDFRLLWHSRSLGQLQGGRARTARPGLTCHGFLAGRDAPCAGCPASVSMMTRAPVKGSVSTSGMEWTESASPVRDAEGGPVGALVFLTETPHPSGVDSGHDVPAMGDAVFPKGASADSVQGAPGSVQSAGTASSDAVDLTGILICSASELRRLFGDRMAILRTEAPVPVPVTAEQLLDTLRRLAEADCGTCLDASGEIILRVDPAMDTPALPGGLPGGRYASVSVGRRELLESSSSQSPEMSGFCFISPFPMGASARSHGAPGGVFVSKDGGRGRFYRILISEAQPGGVAVR